MDRLLEPVVAEFQCCTLARRFCDGRDRVRKSRAESLRLIDGLALLDVNPVLTRKASGAPTGHGWGYTHPRPQFGANVRWGITSNLTLNGTVRPDFAEVESDAGQFVIDPRQSLFSAWIRDEAAVEIRKPSA